MPASLISLAGFFIMQSQNPDIMNAQRTPMGNPMPSAPARPAVPASSIDDLFKPKGLEKYDPQGYGLSMAGSALKGLAESLISADQSVDRTPRRLEISDAAQVRRGSRFDLGRFLSSLSNGGL